MEATEVKKVDVNEEEINSLKGTLFATIIFVGGGIAAFIVLLFVVFMTRI